MHKLLLVLASTMLLGGCTLSDYLPGGGDAARDVQDQQVVLTPTPTLSPEPSLSTETSDAALEMDLNATIIQDEDFSDLE